MAHKIQNWAFIAPKFSRDLSQYFEGFVDFVKDDPAIFAHAFVYDDPNLSAYKRWTASSPMRFPLEK